MVKLSQQQRGGIISRTQRVIEQRKEQLSQQAFQRLKQKAEGIQGELSSSKTIEEYELKYSQLDPELKSFFTSPTELYSQKTQRISEAKTKVIEKKNDYEQKLKENQSEYEQKLQKLEEWYSRDENRASKKYYKETKREYEYDFEIRRSELFGLIKGLSEGITKLNQGEDLSYESIEDYSNEIGQNERDRKEAQTYSKEKRIETKIQIKNLESQGYEAQVIESSYKGQPKKTSVTFYNPTTKKFANVEGLTFDTKGNIQVAELKKVGFTEPVTRTIDFYGKKFQFQSRLPFYEGKDKKTYVTAYGDTKVEIQQPVTEVTTTDIPLSSTTTTMQSLEKTGSYFTDRLKPTGVNYYNRDILRAYAEKKDDIKIKDVWGDAQKGFSIRDLTQGGSYSDSTSFLGGEGKVINVNKLFSSEKDAIVSHEVGHSLADIYQSNLYSPDGQTKASLDLFKESSVKTSGKLGSFFENLGYDKNNLGEEYFARSFATYIKDPKSFKNKFPDQSLIFESLLDYQKTSNVPFKFQEIKNPRVETIKVEEITPTNINFSQQSSVVLNKDNGILGNFIIDKVVPAFSWAKDRVHFDFGISNKDAFGNKQKIPQINVFSFGKRDTPTLYEKGRLGYLEFTGELKEDIKTISLGANEIKQSEAFLEAKYQPKFQTAFEEKYYDPVTKGEITFDQAVSEFQESEITKELQLEYSKEYEKEMASLYSKLPLGKRVLSASAYGIVSSTELGFDFAKDPLTAGLVIGGASVINPVLTALPSPVLYGTTIGFGAYGTKAFLDPTSSIEKASAGLITAVVSGATLGYAGYRYLRSPKIIRTEIPPPKASLKADRVVMKDFKMGAKIFPNQKVSITSTKGYRTIVSTKGRALFKMDPIYRGVPTQQLGKTYTLYGFGRSPVVSYTTRSGYEKAFKLLTKYGYTSSQATATLRYTAPKIYEQTLTSGEIYISGKKYYSRVNTLIKNPVISVDKSLGIKTRGGRDFVLTEDVKGRILTLKDKDLAVLVEKLTIKSGYVGSRNLKINFKPAIRMGKAGEIFEGSTNYLKVSNTGLKVAGKINLQRVSGMRFSLNGRNLDITTGKSLLVKDFNPEDEIKFVKIIGGKKTPFSKTFGQSSNTDVNQVTNKIRELEKIGGTSQIGSPTKEIKQIIKQVYIPKNQIREFQKVTPLPAIKLGITNELILSNILSSGMTLKGNQELKSSLNLKNILKSIQTPTQDVKQNLSFKFSPALKTALKTKMSDFEIVTPITPRIIDPVIPVVPIVPPKIIPFYLPYLDQYGKKRKKEEELGQINIQAYLPDFTSRALGLKAETITRSQANTRLKKLLSGFEIRRGVVIK